MTKEKRSAKSKKTNNSEAKAGKQSGLAKIFKDLAEKVVSPSKPVGRTAQRDASKSRPGGKAAQASAPSDNNSDNNKESKPVETPVAPAATAANGALDASAEAADEVVLTDAEGRRYCRATDCDQVGVVDGYCRYHYLFFWKKIQVRKKILADGKLERYIEELTARYTDKFIELLRKDLRTEKDFLAAVQELELDDSSSGSPQDEDEAKSYLEEISGVASESSSRDEDSY